ncbi:protein STRUBBELIG-RECEPTOR FAMILY 7-like [Mangifera indica]|uniref:protein STRUBBELIG-RECEPTOR FAMILY 7-like n=1 Tax=Mangifera indica TaxID=29780 RepID=UPI001CFA713D|nr:protein STRUBBELIG-RECEPTOR FAMILY 7-like [Mangifera indica]
MVEKWRRASVFVWLILCILEWKPPCINAATDPSDASALKTMYSTLNSPSQLNQWTGDDPCGQSWKGVTCSSQRVTEIKISGLQLTGQLGWQLSSLTSLTNLDVSNNNLGDSIPYNLPPNLTRLNLEKNNFTGSLPYYISQMTSLEYINLAHNKLQGQLNDIFGQLSSLSTLDLSSNSLTGNLPESFSSLSSLSSLYLQNNQFTGPIDVLANLPLDNLNIANNHFTGWIPEQLKNINLNKDGNSFNSGPAPPPPPGTPPASKSSPKHKNSGDNSPSNSGDSSKSGIGGGGIAGIVISIIVVGAIIAFFLVKRRSRKSSLDMEKLDNQPFAPLASNEVQEMKSMQTSSAISTKSFETSASINLRPPPIDRHKSFDDNDFSKKPIVVKKAITTPKNVTAYSIADLQMATGSFNVENLLGEGTFGRVYRAQFDNGKVLAVKKIDSSALPSEMSEDFPEIVSNISELHHPNVVELVGYCSEYGQHLLIYEFHKNGSLHDFLHLSDEDSKPLIWNTRIKIALGTARALEYLHEVCSPSIVHKNIKSANILLDTELNPHLSDSGMGSYMPNADQLLNNNAGAGYSAPEVALSGQFTINSDVYSFGVVMLELLTGRKPFDSSRPRSEQSLVRWATPQLHDIDALAKMVDPALNGLYPVKSLSRFADVIALCVQPEPEFRPPMSEVVQALVRLVQRANMSRRTIGNEQGASQRGDNQDTQDYMS